MIKLTIQSQLKDAMRAKDTIRLDTLRYVLSEIKYEEIAKQRELSDDESLAVLSREVKKRKDAIELFNKSGRNELVREETEKLQIILSLMPKQLERDELERIVDEVVATATDKNFGMIMKEVMNRVKGQADGKVVSEVVKAKLT